MKERNILIDSLKGFAIILVVIGHAIQYLRPASFDSSFLFRVIYSFHMPLFMFMSGFVSFKTFDGSLQKLHKRFKSLIVPFFAWFFVGFFSSSIYVFYTGGTQSNFFVLLKNLLVRPDNGLWFLWVLFLMYILLFLSLKVSSKKEEYVLALFFIGLSAVSVFFPWASYFGLRLLTWHLVFYIAGYSIHKYMLHIKHLLRIAGIISICLFPFFVTHWTREHASFLYKITVPFMGIFGIYILFEILIAYKFFDSFKKMFVYFGQISLEVYVVHFYFFNLVFLPIFYFYAQVFFAAAIALCGSIIFQYFIKKSNILSTLLFGKSISNNVLIK